MGPMMGPMGPQPPKDPPKEQDLQKFVVLSDPDLHAARRRFVFKDPPPLSPVTREEVVGANHILEIVEPYIEALKHPEIILNSSVLPSGLLFMGSPGTGKTYMARYMATKSKARFIVAGEFPRRGTWTASDIGAMFDLCREYVETERKPIILFWDEIDGFARQKAKCRSEDHIMAVERFSTELSGSKGEPQGIFIIGTTNNPYDIEPALMRAGRLGKRITFQSPERPIRKAIIKFFTDQIPHEELDLETLSHLTTPNSTPPWIKDVVHEANLAATLRGISSGTDEKLTNDDLVKELLQRIRGAPNSITLSDEVLRGIAIYEMARAIVARELGKPTQLLALTKRGYGDAHRITNYEVPGPVFLSALKHEIIICFAGSVAHEMCGISRNTKQNEDLTAATAIAQRLVEHFGINTEGNLTLTALTQSRDAAKIPSMMGFEGEDGKKLLTEIKNVLETSLRTAKAMLNRYGVEGIEQAALTLIHKGHLLEADIDRILIKDGFNPDAPPEPKSDDAIEPGQYL